MEPKYHGNTPAARQAAIDRAKREGGMALRSVAPGHRFDDPMAQWGYWSDKVGFIRTQEEELPLT